MRATTAWLRRVVLVLSLGAGTAVEVGGQAQVSGSALPRPSRTKAALHDSLTTSYEVGGIRVIHRLTPANDVVAANIYLLGGVRQVTDQDAGVEALLLEASDRGTREYAGERVRTMLSRLGS